MQAKKERHVFYEESFLNGLTTRLFSSSSQFEIGLLLGNLSTSLSFFVATIPTPEEEKPRTNWASVNEDWIAQHAKHVTQLLPGGLSVIGVYVYCPTADTTKYSAVCNGVLRKIHRVDHRCMGYSLGEITEDEITLTERIVLQVCSQTKRTTCKRFNVTDAKATGQPIELKSQALLSKLQPFHCTVPFSIRIAVYQKKAQDDSAIVVKDDDVVSSLSPIISSLAVIRDVIADPSFAAPVPSDLQNKRGSSATSVNVNLFFAEPVHVDHTAEASSEPETAKAEPIGLLIAEGSIHAKAFVNFSGVVNDVATAIRIDACRSIFTRIDRELDEGLEHFQSNSNKRWLSARRCFFPLPGTQILLSDYMHAQDSVDDVAGGLSELLGSSISPAQIDQSVEVLPDIPKTPKREMTGSSYTNSTPKSATKAAASTPAKTGSSSSTAAAAATTTTATTETKNNAMMMPLVIAVLVVILAILTMVLFQK